MSRASPGECQPGASSQGGSGKSFLLFPLPRFDRHKASSDDDHYPNELCDLLCLCNTCQARARTRADLLSFRSGETDSRSGILSTALLADARASTSTRSQYGDRGILIDAERPSRVCGMRSKWFHV